MVFTSLNPIISLQTGRYYMISYFDVDLSNCFVPVNTLEDTPVVSRYFGRDMSNSEK